MSGNPDRNEMTPAGLDRLARILDAKRELGQQPTTLSPQQFGRFRLIEVLGEGRFGIVFLAEDPRAGRTVAIKLPHAGVMSDGELARRFHRDAEAAAPLDHPGIVPILEVGMVETCPFLVMPYVSGPTLAVWLAMHPGPQPPAEAVDLVVRLAGAVQHANERGVLHCDLKPANILLAPLADLGVSLSDYSPRVVDFGLARLLRADPAGTLTHLVAGTPPYMAPEQAFGRRRDLSARCDVHALAAILYELLAGKPPYGDTYEERLGGLLEPEQLPDRLTGVPRDLEAVVFKGLEKSPEGRYGGAADFAADLHRWREGRPTLARPVGLMGTVWRWAKRRPIVATSCALVLFFLTLGGYAGAELARHAERLRLAEEATAQREFYRDLEQVRRRAIERPDGWVRLNLTELRRLSRASPAAEERAELRSQAVTALREPRVELVRELIPGKNAYAVAFASDGRTIALGERYPVEEGNGQLRVWLVSRETGAIERVLTYPVDREWEKQQSPPRADGARCLLFCPEQRWLAVGTRSGLVYVWERMQGESRVMQSSRPRGRKDDIVSLATSREGTVLYAGTKSEQIEGWSPNTGRSTGRLFTGRLSQRTAGSSSVWLNQFGGGSSVWHRADLLAAEYGPALLGQGGAEIVTSPGGDGVIVNKVISEIKNWIVMPESGTSIRGLFGADQPGGAISTEFRPDGQLLAVGSEEPSAVELRDALSTQTVVRYPHRGGSGRLAFSPDGRFLAVCEAERALLYQLTMSPIREVATGDLFEVGRFAASGDGSTVGTLELWGHTGYVVPRLPEFFCTLILSRRGRDHRLVEWERYRVPMHGEPPQVGVALSEDGHDFAVISYTREGGAILGRQGKLLSTSGIVSILQFDALGQLWVGDDLGLRIVRSGGAVETIYRMSPEEDRAGVSWTACSFDSQGGAVIGRRDGRLLRFSAEGRLRGVWRVFADQGIRAVDYSERHSEILVGGELGTLLGIDPATGRETRRIATCHRAAITGIVRLPSGGYLTASEDHRMLLWNSQHEQIVSLREAGPILQVELRGSELYVRVIRELGLRVYHLDRIVQELRALGIDPGFAPAPNGLKRPAPAGLRVSVCADERYGWIMRGWRGGMVACSGIGQTLPWFPPGAFSQRWEGRIRPPRRGRWEFKVETNRNARMWIQGERILSTGIYADQGEKSCGTVELSDRAALFRMDFMSSVEGGNCLLLWRPEGAESFVPVPAKAFSES